jgi:uncharacterized membrane protein YeaQ/YmgE (transglycosylase-associated protein family)
MYWFIIGAIFGIIHVMIVGEKRSLPLPKDPILGVLAAAVLGALTYGTMMWLIFS